MGARIDADALRGVFDYFASQLFDNLPKEQQRTLLELSFPPRTTVAIAEEISGNLEAGSLLASLHRRHLFIDCRERLPEQRRSKISGGAAPCEQFYQFHALFRAFLQQRARAFFSEGEMRILRSRAG